MKKLILCIVLMMLAANLVNAAAYIKFDGVDGESSDEGHINWAEVLSFNHIMTQPEGPATGASRRRGSVDIGDVEIVKELDKAGPKIAEAITTGKIFPQIEIELTRDYDDQIYLRYELNNVQITSYNIYWGRMSSNVDAYSIDAIAYFGQMPTEKVSMNFEEMTVTYTEYDSDGNKKGNVEYKYKSD